MFIKNKILGVNNGLQIRRTPNSGSNVAQYAARKEINAGFGLDGASGSNVNVQTMWSSEYQYYMTGLIGSAGPQYTDSAALALFYRDMYLYDSIAGSAVDIQSSFPFSDFELRGLDEEDLKPFKDSIERLNIRRMMPEISIAHLTDGYFCGSLIFDPVQKQFVDTMVHDALNCQIKHVPFYNVDPEITVNVPPQTREMLNSGGYTQRYLSGLPQGFLDLLASGNFKLDPIATLFVPRKGLNDRAYVSYLHRILPMYLIEKAMFRGTLTESHRRQRAMTHITAGDDIWTPTDEELTQLVQQFQMAEYDPLGGWISTRNAVQSTDIRPAGDFWKWTDMVDVMVQYKLRALGISEAFLSGDASYAAAESAYSTFLESQDSYRGMLTDRVFYQKIFPLIAVVHDKYKDEKQRKSNDAQGFLFNSSLRSNLKIPEVYWHKQLQSDTEEGMMDMLEKLDERGVPVPLKMWMTAAKIDSDILLRELKEDGELRAKLAEYTGKDTSHDGDEDLPEDFSDDLNAFTISSGATRKVPILSRNYGDGLIYTTNRSGSGKKHVHNQVKARKDSNANIVKAAINARDPSYREFLRRRNIEKLGTSVIPGAGETRSK